MEQLVKDYFDPSKAGSFGGVSTYARHSKGSLDELATILNRYPAFSQHRPVRRRFPRNKIVTGGPDHMWFADLADVSDLRTFNNNTRFLLCAVDGFSKFGFVELLKNKTPAAVRDAFKRIFKRTDRRPKQIYMDAGREFTGRDLKTYLDEQVIELIRAYTTEMKSSPAERFIKSYKSRLYRYMTHNKTKRYLDVLHQLETGYNRTYHRSIGTSPESVNETNKVDICHRLYDSPHPPKTKYPSFSVGDYMRLALIRTTFHKGYKGGWTPEVFKVVAKRPGDPPSYKVKALDDEEILGTFNPYELLKVPFDPTKFIPEKVNKTRTRRGKKEYFVKWQGWPTSFDSWTTNRNERQ